LVIKPNFFIVGAPKCGTTALSEYLRSHPNVFISDPKEPLLFAQDIAGRIVRDESKYLSLFETADPLSHLAIGEGSACYLCSDLAIPLILKMQPTAKIIVMVRNPVALVQSFHSELLLSGEEDISDFEEAWGLEDDRRHNRKVPVSCRSRKWLYYSEWGKLGSQIKRLYRIAHINQVKVIVFDDFVQDTAAVYRDVLSFLSVPDDGRREFPVVNERKSVKSPAFQRLLAVGEKYVAPALRDVFGRSRWFGIRTRLTRLNSFSSEKKVLTEAFSEELRSFYVDEVMLLSEIINRDLSSWISGHSK